MLHSGLQVVLQQGAKAKANLVVFFLITRVPLDWLCSAGLLVRGTRYYSLKFIHQAEIASLCLFVKSDYSFSMHALLNRHTREAHLISVRCFLLLFSYDLNLPLGDVSIIFSAKYLFDVRIFIYLFIYLTYFQGLKALQKGVGVHKKNCARYKEIFKHSVS